MDNIELQRRVDLFMSRAVSQWKSKSFATISELPEWPASVETDLEVPCDLLEQKCKFSLMKDTLPDGAIRVAVQYSRHRFLGIGEMSVDGFVVSPEGVLRGLSEQDRWDLT